MSLESNSVVDLNVGGLLYTTSVDTLTKVRLIISIMCKTYTTSSVFIPFEEQPVSPNRSSAIFLSLAVT